VIRNSWEVIERSLRSTLFAKPLSGDWGATILRTPTPRDLINIEPSEQIEIEEVPLSDWLARSAIDVRLWGARWLSAGFVVDNRGPGPLLRTGIGGRGGWFAFCSGLLRPLSSRGRC
jgi:hypothetical protein